MAKNYRPAFFIFYFPPKSFFLLEMEFVFPPNFGGIVVDGVFIAADNDVDVVDVDAFVDIHVRDGLDVETCTGISDMLECLRFLSLLNLSLLVLRTST